MRGSRMIRSTILFSLFLLVAQTANAAPRVFHSPNEDGNEPVGVPTLPTDDDLLFLYVVGDGVDSTSGAICEDADGDELCAWNVVLHPGPNTDLGPFTPEPEVIYSSNVDELRANGMDVFAQDALPIRIGTLQIWTKDPGAGGMVFVDGVQVVTAGLEVEPIQTEAIAALPVPEPGTVLQAAFLIAASAWLARSPRSRRSVRAGASLE